MTIFHAALMIEHQTHYNKCAIVGMSVQDIEEYFFNTTMKQYFTKEKLHTLQLEINTDCAQNCQFCYVQNTALKGTRLEESFIRSILEQAADMDTKVIEWLGGDPVRHPSFQGLIEFATELGFKNNIWTSGDLLTTEFIEEFLLDPRQNGFVSFHLDTLNPDVYRQLAQHPEYIKKVLDGVDSLLNAGISPDRLNNCMTFTKYQAGADFENTVRTLFEKYGIASGIVPYKPAADFEGSERFIPNTEEMYNAYKFISSTIYDSKLPVTPNCVSKFYCGTTASLTVGKYLTPCSRIRHPVIYVKDSNFTEAFESARSDLLKLPLRDPKKLSETCRTCKYSDICWGCRGNAYYYAGDYLGEDVKCWHRK